MPQAATRLTHRRDPDTDTIVRQHHELPDGTGVPLGLSHKQLTPLSCLFMMAHRYVDRVMLNGEKTLDFFAFLDEERERFSTGFFRKIMLSLDAVRKQQGEV